MTELKRLERVPLQGRPMLDLYEGRWEGGLLHRGDFVICADETAFASHRRRNARAEDSRRRLASPWVFQVRGREALKSRAPHGWERPDVVEGAGSLVPHHDEVSPLLLHHVLGLD